ncbi:serine/threonine-protein kinase [Dactylosporangium sp. NPDC000555]|uniref:serine/threonine-protein kinase n=1 Tax=Dactylosporangium sp. NPDC000555 TaxID=3154260 RepID=UPI0033226F19
MRTPPEARYDTDGHRTSGDLTGYRIDEAYELIEPIGGGGTGTVWRARALDRDEHVAVKLLREDLMAEPKAVDRFVQERAILLMLRHPHIVGVRDLVTVGPSLGLVMDLVEGGSLRDHLHRQGTLPPAEAATLLAQVAEALSAAHRRGVVHRDLKPDNILLDRVDGELQCRLTDFGIARVLDTPSMTTPGVLVGTANYVAPETVYGGRPGPAADIYALGVVLFELTTGRPAYAGGPASAILRRHVDESPRRVDGMPDAIWQIVQECMDRRPGRRPAARELAVALRAAARRTRDEPALPPRPVDEGPASPRPPVPRPRTSPSRSRGTILGAVLLVLALLAVPAWRYAHREHGADPAGDTRATPAPAAPPPSQHARAGAQTGFSSRGPGSVRVSDKSEAPSVQPAADVERSVVFGPWICGDQYTWGLGQLVLAQPCYALAPDDIRMIGHMRSIPGVQADVSLSVLDAETGRLADGPHTCNGLMFTDAAPKRDCGPFEARLPHGHRYVVVQKWSYTGRALLPGGQVRGQEFDR